MIPKPLTGSGLKNRENTKRSFFISQCRWFSIQKLLGPVVHKYPFFFENGFPPPPFDPPSTRIWWHGHWKRIFSKTLSRVKILENAGFSFMSGRTKIRWCHISYTANPLLSPPGGLIQTLSRGKARLNGEGVGLFKLFSETHQRKLARHILHKGYYRIYTVLAFSCGRAKTIRIRYVWMHIFLKTEKKFTFSKISGNVWPGP